jgi:hypothetical protein
LEDNQGMTSQPPDQSPDEGPPADATRELHQPFANPTGPPSGYRPPPGYGPPPEYLPPEPRFAGQQYGQPQPQQPTQPYGQQRPSAYAPPAPNTYGNGYGAGVSNGLSWPPLEPPWPPLEPPWPSAPPPNKRRTGLWVLVTLLILALIGGAGAAVALTSGSSKSNDSASGGTPTAPPSVPGPTLAPTPTPSGPSQGPTPNPSVGLVPTPPGLLAIGYHGYELNELQPSDVAIDSKEVVQFSRDGLQQIVGLRALTIGRLSVNGDDYDAAINVLRFKIAAGAQAELAYSNSRNKQTAPTIPLPGLPSATGFLNKADASNGISVGAFTTVGRYQVVVILRGLDPNRPTDAKAVAAEAARVMRAVLPDVADIQPPAGGSGGGGGGGGIPDLPTPTPTGTRA